MDVVVQYFEGCPNWQQTRDLVQQALHEVGLPTADLVLQAVETEQAARATGFRGSPSVLLDGVDPFADPDAAVGLSCRMFQTPAGLAGAPTLEQLVSALDQHASGR